MELEAIEDVEEIDSDADLDNDEDAEDDFDDEEDDEEDDELSDEEFSSEEKVRIMATAADSLRADAIVALDLRELTIIADYFLICTGNSSIQIRSIADRIEERMRDLG